MPKLPKPEAPAEDLTSVESIRAAFERLRPARPQGRRPGPELVEARRRFGSFVRAAAKELLGEDAEEPLPLSAWSPEQRAFLEEVAKTPYEDVDLGHVLERAGAINLGDDDDDRYLARYVGLRAPSPLETEVSGKPIWLWLRLHLMGKLARAAWLEVVAGLETSDRIDLARRALDNAYQLMRRWPLPGDVTLEIERADAAKLHAALAPALEDIPLEELESAFAEELSAPNPEGGLLVLVATLLVKRGVALPADAGEALASALSLMTNVDPGRELLSLIPADKRREIAERIELTPYNLDGWVYLDLLTPEDRGELISRALAGFGTRPLSPNVARVLEKLQAASV